MNILEAAVLSSHVYNVNHLLFSRSVSKSSINENNEISNSFNGWYRITDADPTLKPSANFYAALYIKFQNGKAQEAVMAFRGTIFNLTNIWQDVYGWYSAAAGTDWHNHVPPFYSKAVFFVNAARAYLKQHYNDLLQKNAVSFTGHSLGGALAQLLTLRHHHSYPSVVFNSPGCGEIAGDIDHQQYQKVSNINARYGIINKIGRLVGSLKVVDIPEDEAEAKLLLQNFDKQDFQNSVGEERIAENLKDSGSMLYEPTAALAEGAGIVQRLQSISSSWSAMASLSQSRWHDLACDAVSSLGIWGAAGTLVTKTLCQASFTIETISQVIGAQHSINNMVKALQGS